MLPNMDSLSTTPQVGRHDMRCSLLALLTPCVLCILLTAHLAYPACCVSCSLLALLAFLIGCALSCSMQKAHTNLRWISYLESFCGLAALVCMTCVQSCVTSCLAGSASCTTINDSCVAGSVSKPNTSASLQVTKAVGTWSLHLSWSACFNAGAREQYVSGFGCQCQCCNTAGNRGCATTAGGWCD